MRGCRPLTDLEIRQLLDALSAPSWLRERMLILLGIRTGLRLTSMLSLRIGDVAIAGEVQNRIRVRRATTKGQRSGFDMPLHPQAATALQEYRFDARPHTQRLPVPGPPPENPTNRIQGWRAIKAAFDWAGMTGHQANSGPTRCAKPSPDSCMPRSTMIWFAPLTPCDTLLSPLPFNTCLSGKEEVDAAILNLSVHAAGGLQRGQKEHDVITYSR